MDVTGLLHTYLGSGPKDITWWQMALRAAIIFVFGLCLLRLAPRRTLGHSTVLDLVLAVILGSTLSRALTANAPLLPTMAAAAALVALHYGVTRVAAHVGWFERAVKGGRTRLVRDGEIDWQAMHGANLSKNDLMTDLRINAGVTDLSRVEAAYLERSGEISVIVAGR